jgi:uroporphyrinogen decarboxylase
MTHMSQRQRMLVAIKNQQPDRVPVAPDISNMVPCRLTGKPFWEIYVREDPPLWRAYLDAVRYFGIDGWFIYGDMQFKYENLETVEEGVERYADYWLVRYRHRTAAGDRPSAMRYGRADSPVRVEWPIRDVRADFDWIRAWYEDPVGHDPGLLREQRAALGEDGAFGICVDYPGLQAWVGWVAGGLQQLAYWAHDEPRLIAEWRELMERQVVRQVEMILTERPDFFMLHGSGTITLQSPALARELSLPTVQKLTRMAHEAGVPTLLHSCGRERDWVQMCAEETELDCINPLEPPPMGDCDLAEIKHRFGDRLALMGNLHTTDVMWRGTPEAVREASQQAIEAAGGGGGFILSTGDQCGRDTPDANLFAMVEAAETYGRYR